MKEYQDQAPSLELPNGNNGLDLKHNYVRAPMSMGHAEGKNPEGKKCYVPEAMTVLFK